MTITKKTYSRYTKMQEAVEAEDMTLADAKVQRLTDIKTATYNYVVAELPEWRQISWNKYVILYERLEKSEILNAADQAFYNNFPDSGETYETCYDDVLSAISWVNQCLAANDAKETELSFAVNIAGVVGVQDPTYPPWPL